MKERHRMLAIGGVVLLGWVERGEAQTLEQQLGEALDQPGLTWEQYIDVMPGGWGYWEISPGGGHDGGDFARLNIWPGSVLGPNYGYLRTRILGPADVSFWYWIGYDSICRFSADSVGGYLASSSSWARVTYEVGPGIQSLYWWMDPSPYLQTMDLDQLEISYPTAPRLHVTPEVVSRFSLFLEGSVVTQALAIANWGAGTMAYSVTSNVPWLSATPDSGSSTGETDTVFALLDPTGMSLGVSTGKLSVIAPEAERSPKEITFVATVSVNLAEALDNDQLIWASSSSTPWFGQIEVSKDGQDSACSGVIGTWQSTSLTAPVIGPGDLSFWWSVSSATNAHKVRFWLDSYGSPIASMSGESGWQFVTSRVPEGAHTIGWTYDKSFSTATSGLDAAWVDQVTYVRQGPTLRRQPAGFTNAVLAGNNVTGLTFRVWNAGTGTVSYTISSDAGWLSASAPTGAVDAATNTVGILCNTAGLPGGDYVGHLDIAAPNAIDSPTQVTVRVRVIPTNGATFHVSPSGSHVYPFASWLDAATNIQEALDYASSGSTVLVINGRYLLSKTLTINNGILFKSFGGASATILDGQNSNRCIVVSNSAATVEGFSVVRGRVTAAFGSPVGGAGIYAPAGVRIRQCIIRDNLALGARGADGWGMWDPWTMIWIKEPATAGGTAEGGGVWLGSNSVMESSLVFSNEVVGGMGGDGGVLDGPPTPAPGGAGYGAGIHAQSGTVVVLNSTICDNIARGGLGGLYYPNTNRAASGTAEGGGIFLPAGAEVRNSIVMYNTSTSNGPNHAGSATFRSSCISPLVQPGNSNMDSAPLFVDRSASNYRLQSGSPCRDAGAYEAWMAAAFDLDAAPRLSDAAVDLGAYEYREVLPDADGDGIPDEWEGANGLNPAVSNAPASNIDHDPYTDFEEYVANTSPTNPAVFFHIATSETTSNVISIVVSPSSPDRLYDLLWKTNLMSEAEPWTPCGLNRLGTGGPLVLSVTNNAPLRFYRTSVRLP